MAKRKLNERDVPEAVNGDVHPVSSEKKGLPPTFASLGLDARLLQALQREKLVSPTHVQMKAIPSILDKKNLLVRAKTGSGKTLAYVLPILQSVLKHRDGLGPKERKEKKTLAVILVPTKELANQVAAVLRTFAAFCGSELRSENLSRKEDETVTKARLASNPDIIIATPSRAALWLENGYLKLQDVRQLVIDEADLILSYGYEDDLHSLSKALPIGIQTSMMSATLRADLGQLQELFYKGSPPQVLDLSQQEAEEKPSLAHYIVRTAEEDKFLLIYAIFKLQLIKGKVIIFVADVDRSYRAKLFLEQFGIRACVLNSELPVNSRLHVVEEFNRGVYDIIIAADDTDVVGNETDDQDSSLAGDIGIEMDVENAQDTTGSGPNNAEAETLINLAAAGSKKKHAKSKSKARHEDLEYGVSRGIDFHAVTCVLNFDLPASPRSYIHRVGRTARAGKTGMALSFYVPRELYRKHKPTSILQSKDDEEVLEKIRGRLEKDELSTASIPTNIPPTSSTESREEVRGLQEWTVDWSKLESLRYRFVDALRSVTRIAVREARTRELRQELINSEKLKRHFEENPEDLRHLRHDRETRVGRQMTHLRHLPDYLLPNGIKEGLGKDVGFVGLSKVTDNRIRKARQFNKARGKRKPAKGKRLDPLKSLSVKGNARK